MFIAMYDEEDNIITTFESKKECAEYFGTTINCINSFFSRVHKGIRNNKKLNKVDKKWYKLYQYQKEEL